MKRRLLTFCGAVVALALTSTSQAELVDYWMTFVVDSGTFNGVNIAGTTVTATGSIIDEIDLIPGQSDRGAFAATSVYDLGAFGIFATDVGADYFFQFQSGTASQYGLLDDPGNLSDATRLQDTAGLSPMADPNIPEATGSFRYDDGGPFGNPRTMTNSGGDMLIMSSYSYTASGDNVNITPAVPAPGALAMLGLAGLVGARRRRMA